MALHRLDTTASLSNEINSSHRSPRSNYSNNAFGSFFFRRMSADDVESSSSSSMQRQLRFVEEQLIEMKIELATSRTREDYLMLQVQKLTKVSDEKERENRELKCRLERFEDEGRCRGSRQDGCREENIVMNRQVRKTADYENSISLVPAIRKETFDNDGAVKKGRQPPSTMPSSLPLAGMPHLPSSVGLAYIDKSNAISCLSLSSAASSEENRRSRSESVEGDYDAYVDCNGGDNNNNNGGDYDEDYGDYYGNYDDERGQVVDCEEPDRNDYKVPIHGQKGSRSRATATATTTNDNNNNNTKKGKISLHNSTSCASGIAFLHGVSNFDQDEEEEEEKMNSLLHPPLSVQPIRQLYSVPLNGRMRGEKVRMPDAASCASGLAFMHGKHSMSMLSIKEELSLGEDEDDGLFV